MSEYIEQFEPNDFLRAHRKERLFAAIAESHFLLKALAQQREIADLILPKREPRLQRSNRQTRRLKSGNSSLDHLGTVLYNPDDNQPLEDKDWATAMTLLMQQTAPEPEMSDGSK